MRKKRARQDLPLLPFFVLIALIFLRSLVTTTPSYEISSCEVIRGGFRPSASYDRETKVAVIELQTNCCGVGLEVKKSNSEVVIQEVQHGTLCRCVCSRRVTIKEIEENFSVVFLTLDGRRLVLLPSTGFCGFSSYGFCESDGDCIVTGCSGQVCSARGESIFTTCEWRECYDSRRFGLKCKCIANACQWVKS